MEPVFVSRELELGRLNAQLDQALAGVGQVCFVTGEAGFGKTSLCREFARQAQVRHSELLVANGNCNAQTGIADPYLPFREILELLTGEGEERLASGAVTQENAWRLQRFWDLSRRVVSNVAPDLIHLFVPGIRLQLVPARS